MFKYPRNNVPRKRLTLNQFRPPRDTVQSMVPPKDTDADTHQPRVRTWWSWWEQRQHKIEQEMKKKPTEKSNAGTASKQTGPVSDPGEYTLNLRYSHSVEAKQTCTSGTCIAMLCLPSNVQDPHGEALLWFSLHRWTRKFFTKGNTHRIIFKNIPKTLIKIPCTCVTLARQRWQKEPWLVCFRVTATHTLSARTQTTHYQWGSILRC